MIRETSFDLALGGKLHVAHDPTLQELAYLGISDSHEDQVAAVVAGPRVKVSGAADADTVDALIAHLETVRDDLRRGDFAPPSPGTAEPPAEPSGEGSPA